MKKNERDQLCELLESASNRKQKNSALVFQNIEHFVQTHGRFFDISSRQKNIKLSRANKCFENSQRATLEQGLIYVEGFIFSTLFFPIHHAWCIDANNQVVDLTLNVASHMIMSPAAAGLCSKPET